MNRPNEANRPLRMFDKVLSGGLGPGNLGLLMSRHGTGKTAVMTSVAIDHAMNEVPTLHLVYGKSVEAVRAYDDEVLREILVKYDIKDRAEMMSRVERYKQIYTYRSGSLDVKRLRGTLEFLAEHAQFRPALIEIQGWPEFSEVGEDEIRAIKGLAVESNAEVWLSCHTHREDQEVSRIPEYIDRVQSWISVIIGLQPEGDEVHLDFLKTHDTSPPDDSRLVFDPKTMLIRWH